eukprot:927200-Karenia_brevis.AAC.1
MPAVLDLLLALARPMSSAAWMSLGPVKRLVVIARCVLWLILQSFVEGSSGVPVLASYSADTTPLRGSYTTS